MLFLLQFLFLINAIQCYEISSYTATILNPTDNENITVIIHYPKTKNETFPSIVFSHGWTCHNTWYEYVWKGLVPLGYIVAMPGDDTTAIRTENIVQYTGGQRATLDYLRSQCNGNKQCDIYGLVGNTSAAMGHSMGGGSSILAIADTDLGYNFTYQFDTAFTYSACTELQPIVPNNCKNIKKPFFFLTATQDCLCPPKQYSEKYYNSIPNDTECKYLAVIEKGDHCNFEDSVVGNSECKELEKEIFNCNMDDITPRQQHEIAIKYTSIFLNATLYNKGNSKPLYTELTKMLQADVQDTNIAMYEVGNMC